MNIIDNQITPICYTQRENDYLIKFNGDYNWDKGSGLPIIKEFIKKELEKNQKNTFDDKLRCPYCWRMISQGDIDREHIAPKKTYPYFMFEPNNLVLSCKRCNGVEIKGTYNTIKNYNSEMEYSKQNFVIIHPILDKCSEHLEFLTEDGWILLKPKNSSEKGKETIRLFQLNLSEQLLEYRSMLFRDKQKLTDDSMNILSKIENFNTSSNIN